MQLTKKIKLLNVSNQKEAIELVTKFVEVLKKDHNFNLQKAILFGSFAKNAQHEYSDIDLALWSDDFSGVSFLDYKLFTVIKFQNKAFSDIECHTFSFAQPNPFENEILKTGILIYSNINL